MQKVRVGVLRGGISNEYDISLLSGEAVLRNLPQDKYDVEDILIDKDGVWYHRGLPLKLSSFFAHVDVVFNALHGEYGEDGRVQKILTDLGIPYTGSQVIESAICMNKAQAKAALWSTGIKTPKFIVASSDDNPKVLCTRAYKTFAAPHVIKPTFGGSSIGVTISRNPKEFLENLETALELFDEVIIEEFIVGREVTCGVIDDFRGKRYYTLLPIEIIPKDGRVFFDYEAKYKGGSKELCPGNFTNDESMYIQKLAKIVHKALGLSHYSRSDFIMTPRDVYFLEVNTLPGLTDNSLIPKSLKAVGIEFPDFLDHIVQLAIKG